MTLDIHLSRLERKLTVVPFARNRDGLSVTTGCFLHFDWETFRREGLAVAEKAMRAYHTTNKTEPSEFDKMPLNKRIAFLKTHISLQVVQRRPDLWWIDLMKPVGDGSIPGPTGPPYRVEFRPSEGPERFFDALLRLIPPPDSNAK